MARSPRKKVSQMLETLYVLAAEHGIQVTEPSNGHFLIRGALLVSYYPFSKKRTAYVDKTTQGKHDVSPYEAVQMALRPPAVVHQNHRETRRRSYKAQRRRLWLKSPHCYWCNQLLSFEASTLDHRVPLMRGGLDEPSNFVLACQPCNLERGSRMPEVTEENYVQRKRESNRGQRESGRSSDHDPAAGVLEGHPRGVHDAPDVQPQRQFEPGDPEQGPAQAGP